LTDALGNDYIVLLPKVKYNTGNPEVSGPGAITLTLDFVSLFNSASDKQIKITRVPA
jgi:hypothetical protein